MTQTKQQRRENRRNAIRNRHMKFDSFGFLLVVRYPKGTFISLSELKERMRRALEDAFPETKFVF